MTTISGFTDRGQTRSMQIQRVPEGVRIDLRSPSGTGAGIIVETQSLLDALELATGTVPGVGRFLSKRLEVSTGHADRPRDLYRWIQGGAGNGSSIYVDPAEVRTALRGAGIDAARPARGQWAPENRGLSENLN